METNGYNQLLDSQHFFKFLILCSKEETHGWNYKIKFKKKKLFYILLF